MANEPENLILHQLRELRSEIRERDERYSLQLENLRTDVGAELNELRIGQAALSADLKIVKEIVEDISERLQAVEGRLNTTDSRLARIEKHTGLAKA